MPSSSDNLTIALLVMTPINLAAAFVCGKLVYDWCWKLIDDSYGYPDDPDAWT